MDDELDGMVDGSLVCDTEVVPVGDRSVTDPTSAGEYRDRLVRSYYGGSSGLVEQLKSSGVDDSQSLIVALIDEVLKETDSLLGNRLVAEENGDLRDASVISFKRSEVLEKAMKAIQSKIKLERESGLDLDSPSMVIVFRFFMKKVKEVFDGMGLADEQQDLFFQKFGEVTGDWKRELRNELKKIKSGG